MFHTFLAVLGVVETIYVMQLSNFYVAKEEHHPPEWVMELQRFGLAMLALAFCWSLIYAENRHWTPWPPDVMIIAVVDGILAVRVGVICRNIRSVGLRWWSFNLMIEHELLKSAHQKKMHSK
jgi:branched-subunit amino acid transport protein